MNVGDIVYYRRNKVTIVSNDANDLVTIQYIDDNSQAIVNINTLSLNIESSPNITVFIVDKIKALSERIRGPGGDNSLNGIANMLSNYKASYSLTDLSNNNLGI
jgi:hypothetical protein